MSLISSSLTVLNSYHGDLIVVTVVFCYLLLCGQSVHMILPKTHILNYFRKLSCDRKIIVVVFNPMCAAVNGAFRFSDVVQRMGLAHYARLISASCQM